MKKLKRTSTVLLEAKAIEVQGGVTNKILRYSWGASKEHLRLRFKCGDKGVEILEQVQNH